MKKAILSFVLFFMVLSVFATEYKFSDIKCWKYNKYLERLEPTTIEIKYETDMSNGILFKYELTYYLLPMDNIKDFRSVCEKFFEWEKIAIDNKAEITKDIPITIDTLAMWTHSFDEDRLGMGHGNFKFTFFSQSATQHQLVITTSDIKDELSYNIYPHTLENLYFNRSDVDSLYKEISEENIKKQLEIVKQKQDIESLFN